MLVPEHKEKSIKDHIESILGKKYINQGFIPQPNTPN